MELPEISIIMPAYNAGAYLTDSITSVMGQSFANWELIIVDDGSTDDTAAIATAFLKDKRIKLISQENRGVSAARNAGILAGVGKYVAFLDADDAFTATNLKVKYDLLNANPGIGYVYSAIMLCDQELKDIAIEEGTPADKVRNAILNWEAKSIPGFSSNVLVRMNVIKEKGIYFDTHLSNCADRYYKILLANECDGIYIPQPLVKYRDTPGSMSKKVFLLEHDELYILDRIKEKNIVPEQKKRKKIFAKVYLMLSGSWYKDAGRTGKALKFGLRALLNDPLIFFKLLYKSKRFFKR